MEYTEKEPESDNAGALAGELLAFLAVPDDEDYLGGDFSPEGPIKEELVEEVMQQLWREINGCQVPNNANASTEVFQGSSPEVSAVVGCKESCGPSISDSACTVMAGFEVGVGGGASSGGGGGLSCFVGPTTEEAAGWRMGSPEVAGSGLWAVEEIGGSCYGDSSVKEGSGERVNGCDQCKEVDDEWLTRVLCWGPQEIEEFSRRVL